MMHFTGRPLLAACAAAAFIFLGAQAGAGAAAPSDVKAGYDLYVRGDHAGAVAKWRPLAEAGNADAQFNMGQAYKRGRGVPLNAETALNWYRKAARQGHEQAQANVGLLLYNSGRRQEAMPWIRKAAELGVPHAQYILGTELFNGDLIAKDWPRAYALMLHAADGGIGPAADNLKSMEKFIPVDQRRQGVVIAQGMGRQAQPGGMKTNVFASAPVAVPAKRPAPAKVTAPPPRRTVAPAAAAAGGRWRVQLGAFGSAANAQRAWAGLKGKVGAFGSLQPNYVAAGAVTRLQAGPLGTRAAADKVCAAAKAAGAACFPVAP